MNQKRTWSYDQAAASSPTPPKRQKTFQRNLNDTLPHNRYTIAWICALHIEMAAARAMLDDIHADLPQDANDKNAYMLGSIGLQNIVIACLPNGQYGTNNATNVLTNLKWSFPSICMGLMVGIGGGAPTMADIRLGDVVVGTRVMPYDLGKVVEGGKVQRTASPRFPDQALLTVVSSIRAKHMLEPSRVSTILRDIAVTYPEFSRPTSSDRLFIPAYSHDPQISCCSKCDQSKLLPRSTRLVNDPNIHYGAIASGNHVMKDSTTRDNVARELDIICFEMEAAGLMDVLPCLPIRGICDYSDSHKSKEWQNYAAAAAAAYAREFIEILPVNNGTFENLHSPSSPSQDASPNRRQLLLESLRFEQIDSRKISIKTAHSKTCHWFLKHPQYLEWLDPQKHAHHGFLWIRGKPGAGKSTIMKFIYRKTKATRSHGRAITASFFFHARGEDLEKSIPGMYRSLLLQLLEGYPDLQDVLDDTDLVPHGQSGCPQLNVLKDLFHNAVSNLGQRTFTCFIDALDECDEQQVMEMVRYFEELAESCATTGVQLRICFSSRHYPYIRIRHGIELTLEHQQGHSDDMSNYIQSNLRITSTALVEELRPQMIEKAAGVFLWVVLVVDILNKENSRGRLALRKRLAEVPSGLSELFKDILRRDANNMEDLMLSILWILCAKRPLRPEEYYHALWSGLALKDLVDPEMPDVTAPDSAECIESYVITSSKGLAEIAKAKRSTVQFIHESVRDFLVKDRGLQELWPDLGFDWQGQGHERLKQCCSMYINHQPVHAYIDSVRTITNHNRLFNVSGRYPFLEYASRYVLYHSDAAAQTIPQAEFLSQTPTADWATILNLFETFQIRRYSSTASLIYILADKGFSALIRTWLPGNPCVDIRGERYEYPLFAALANGNKDAVAALLNLASSIYGGVDIAEGFGSKKDFAGYKGRTPLTWAAQFGRMNILKLLLQKGTDIDEIDQQDYTALMRASQEGHHAVVSFLIKEGTAIEGQHAERAMILSFENGHAATMKLLIDAKVHWDPTPESLQVRLIDASSKGDEEMAKILIEKQVHFDAPSHTTSLSIASSHGHLRIVKLLMRNSVRIELSSWGIALVEASEHGHEAIAKLLIEEGADAYAHDLDGHIALSRASRHGRLAIVKLLLEKGAPINPDVMGSTMQPALIEASRQGHAEVTRLLLVWGANIETRCTNGRTPLIEASREGYKEVVGILLEWGADIETRCENGRTALSEALIHGHEGVAGLLIERGADANTRDAFGKSPLHHVTEYDEPLAPKMTTESRNSFLELLLENGGTIDLRDIFGETPLHRACTLGPGSVQRLLIEKGADVNAKNERGQTPLHKVCNLSTLENYFVEVALLIDNGADIHARDSEGSTPLHLAATQNDFRVIRLLVSKGADVNAINTNGDTPMSLIEKRQLPAYNLIVLAIKGL